MKPIPFPGMTFDIDVHGKQVQSKRLPTSGRQTLGMMNDNRPNPDELLARVQEDESAHSGASCGYSLAMQRA